MIIKGKQAICFDLKVLKNAFICTFYDTESEYKEIYEVSERKNQMNDIIGVFKYPDYIFVGYNSIHYGVPIINFIMENQRTMPADYKNICESLYELSQTIIYSENFSDWSKWKHTKHFLTIDLYTMLAAAKDRVGLKEVQITSGYDIIKDVNIDYGHPVSQNEIDSVIECSVNDAKSLKHILYKVEDKIRLREQLSDEYNINLMSKDNVSMGLEIIKKKYLEYTAQEWAAIKDRKTPIETIKLGDCIPQFLEFNTKELRSLVSEMKETTINVCDKKPFEKHLLLDDMEVSLGMGGLHSITEPDIIEPKDDEDFVYADVKSMYPTLILKYEIVPPHINKNAFLHIYEEIWSERLSGKAENNTAKSDGLKHALNSIIGNYRVYTSWLYSPTTAAKVNILGQLFILKLAEMLVSCGANIKQINTDGIMFTAKKSSNYKQALSEWQGLTCLMLDVEYFKTMYQYDIANYLAVRIDGTLVKRGLFVDEQTIGKGMKPKIIAKAINKHFINGKDPEEVITGSKNILDFLTYQKVDKKYNVEYDNQIIQRINRYYASTDGAYLFKCEVEKMKMDTVIVHFKDNRYIRVPKSQIEFGGAYYDNPSVSHFEYYGGESLVSGKRSGYEHMLRDSGVTIMNDLRTCRSIPDNINYRYYIAAAKDVISTIENRQLSLF